MLVALDLVTKSLTDTNLKVALYSIQQFSDLIPILDKSMNPHMNLIV